MPVIRISDATHRKLQRLAIPLVDSPDTVVGRLADNALARELYEIPGAPGAEEATASTAAPETVTDTIDVIGNHPDLTHTKIREAFFNEVEISPAKWNHLMKFAHEMAYRQLGSFQALRAVTNAHIREGRYTGNGFSYLESINISIQGTDSNLCWEHSLRLARQLGVPIRVAFEWYSNSNAAQPGQSGNLDWQP